LDQNGQNNSLLIQPSTNVVPQGYIPNARHRRNELKNKKGTLLILTIHTFTVVSGRGEVEVGRSK
jgi:hypothetical protein